MVQQRFSLSLNLNRSQKENDAKDKSAKKQLTNLLKIGLGLVLFYLVLGRGGVGRFNIWEVFSNNPFVFHSALTSQVSVWQSESQRQI